MNLKSKQTSELSRRSFLRKSGWIAIGATLLFNSGCSFLPILPTTSDNAEEAADSWIQMTPENRIRFYMGKAEMGQGIISGLSQIIAEEFYFSVEDIDAVLPHSNQIESIKMTVGSESISTLYLPLRTAAARLQQSLKAILAKQLGSSTDQLQEEKGGLKHHSSGKFYSYGEIVAQKPQIELLEDLPTLKPPKKFKVIGQKHFRSDVVPKITGKAVYTHDVELPGMLYGKAVKPPVFGATMKSVNTQATQKIKGVVQVVEKLDEEFVGVVATSEFIAQKALKTIEVQWDIPKVWEQKDINLLLNVEQLKKEGESSHSLVEKGDVQKVQAATSLFLQRSYSTPFGSHAAMETHAGVAHITQNRAELWVGSQDNFYQQALAARITGIAKENIDVHPMLIGGSFGGKMLVEPLVEAIHLSKAVQKPVRVIWDREENFQYGHFRPPSQHQVEAGLNAKGELSFWKHEFASGPVIFNTAMMSKRLHGVITTFTADFGGSRGAIHPYRVPAQQIDQWDRILPVPTGAWRGLSSSVNAFAIESTIDDLAHLIKQDPLEFRLKHLDSSQNRLRQVLQKAAEKAKWGEKLPQGKGRGIACGIYKDAVYVAVVAEVTVNSESKSIKVDRLICAHDCGLLINPDSVEAMIEGNLVWGIGIALTENIHLQQGKMSASNFHEFSVPRMSDTPNIETILLEDKDIPPAGAGEPAIMPTPAAIANAVFDATGKRASTLPIQWDELFS